MAARKKPAKQQPVSNRAITIQGSGRLEPGDVVNVNTQAVINYLESTNESLLKAIRLQDSVLDTCKKYMASIAQEGVEPSEAYTVFTKAAASLERITRRAETLQKDYETITGLTDNVFTFLFHVLRNPDKFELIQDAVNVDDEEKIGTQMQLNYGILDTTSKSESE